MSARHLNLLAALLLPLLAAREARSVTLSFDSLEHGEVVDAQFTSAFGVTIHAVNVGGGPDLALAFDSLRSGTADLDLEGPTWSGGNLDPSTVLGRILIVAENGLDADQNGRIDDPDDEGSRPAGSIFFEFEIPVLSFGFDLVDVEGPAEFDEDRGFVAVLSGDDDTELARVGFGEFLEGDSPFGVEGLVFGNNTANRIPAITAAALGLEPFQKVEINLGGSGAIDNVTFEPIPEPSTLLLLAAGLALSALLRPRPRCPTRS